MDEAAYVVVIVVLAVALCVSLGIHCASCRRGPRVWPDSEANASLLGSSSTELNTSVTVVSKGKRRPYFSSSLTPQPSLSQQSSREIGDTSSGEDTT